MITIIIIKIDVSDAYLLKKFSDVPGLFSVLGIGATVVKYPYDEVVKKLFAPLEIKILSKPCLARKLGTLILYFEKIVSRYLSEYFSKNKNLKIVLITLIRQI